MSNEDETERAQAIYNYNMHMLCQQFTFEEAKSILEEAIETNPDLVIDEDWLRSMGLVPCDD